MLDTKTPDSLLFRLGRKPRSRGYTRTRLQGDLKRASFRNLATRVIGPFASYTCHNKGTPCLGASERIDVAKPLVSGQPRKRYY
jgi:hypothetical protein